MLQAVEPWSGNYHVNPQVWTTAHFSQFTSIGDRYLPHGAGTDKLARNFILLVDKHRPCMQEHLTPTKQSDGSAVACFVQQSHIFI